MGFGIDRRSSALPFSPLKKMNPSTSTLPDSLIPPGSQLHTVESSSESNNQWVSCLFDNRQFHNV